MRIFGSGLRRFLTTSSNRAGCCASAATAVTMRAGTKTINRTSLDMDALSGGLVIVTEAAGDSTPRTAQKRTEKFTSHGQHG